MQFQGKQMNQTWENGKKPSFEPYFWPPKICREFYLCYMFDIVPSYHCMQFQGKLMNHTWENGKKLVLRLILAPLDRIWAPKFYSWILPLLHVIHHWKLSLYATSRKTNDPNLRKWKKKKLVSGPILARLS